MLIEELAQEYRTQYNVLCAKMDGLRPLLSVYGGEDLYRLRRKLRTLLRNGLRMPPHCYHTGKLLR